MAIITPSRHKETLMLRTVKNGAPAVAPAVLRMSGRWRNTVSLILVTTNVAKMFTDSTG